MIHSKPRCFECGDSVSPADLIFAPVCGSTSEHDKCGSAVWHGLCLMKWRERMVLIEAQHERIQEGLREFFEDVRRQFDGD